MVAALNAALVEHEGAAHQLLNGTRVDMAVPSLNLWKRYGVRIAIDDFGTGFSSLSVLASLPVDILKIDRTFVSGQASVMPSVSMLEGILGLAAKLDLEVIAEGIEEPEQLELVRTLGCRLGQGFLLARPTPQSALEALLASGGLLHLPISTDRPVAVSSTQQSQTPFE
jgi:EAL domain-containing protein (putative c-di-GMP-specific phosphodiesterase class I)